MSDRMDFAFTSLNNDELFDTLRHHPTNNETENKSNPYEDYISNKYNLSVQEFNYNFDSNDPVQSTKCAYLTENQFKHCSMNTADDTFLLLHLNIRSIIRILIICDYS